MRIYLHIDSIIDIYYSICETMPWNSNNPIFNHVFDESFRRSHIERFRFDGGSQNIQLRIPFHIWYEKSELFSIYNSQKEEFNHLLRICITDIHNSRLTQLLAEQN